MTTSRAGTEVEAANLALSDLGQRGIADLNDRNARARAVLRNFAAVRDELLQKKHWGFATDYDRPAAAVPPSGGWQGPFGARYPLKPDCLKVRYIADAGADDWEVMTAAVDPAGSAAEVKVLATNMPSPLVCYTKIVGDVRIWSAEFLGVFRKELASAMAPLLTGSASRADAKAAQSKEALADAALNDGKERARSQVSRNTSWVTSRRIGGGRWP